jgi:hypothetical protein
MAFSQIEADAVANFNATREIGAVWNGSALRDVVLSAPVTKGRFARQLVSSLAAAAGIDVGSIPDRVGNRRRLGSAICEIKFSTEDPARFQQVRPPEEDYD